MAQKRLNYIGLKSATLLTWWCGNKAVVVEIIDVGRSRPPHMFFLFLSDTPVSLSPVCPRKMLNCGMLERDSRALRKRSIVLCKQLVVDELLIQCLEANNILTPGMAEGILVCTYLHNLLTAVNRKIFHAAADWYWGCSALNVFECLSVCFSVKWGLGDFKLFDPKISTAKINHLLPLQNVSVLFKLPFSYLFPSWIFIFRDHVKILFNGACNCVHPKRRRLRLNILK